MFHAADLLMTTFTLYGATHAFLPKFTPELLFRAIELHRATSILLVPTMILLAVESGIADDYDLSSWEHCIYGTAPMSPELIQRFARIFPHVELAQAWGLTETAPILTVLDSDSHREALESGRHEALKSCGKPLPGVDLRVLNDEGAEAPVGEAGEFVVRGPNVFGGYLNLEEETRRALKDGWFHTGDIGLRGDDGNYYILDRKQNMIITGGENVYSNEVESILYQHSGVQEVAVIGLADKQYGETVAAVVVSSPGSDVTGEELREFCKGKIGNYKIPRRFEFVDELPKSAVGKILKRKLKEMYSG
jgi:long-chain acyl-CoA synthetase